MNKLQSIHPFPARMAPEIALEQCKKLQASSLVLDPMCGSGTTLRTAIECGINAIGSDLDPMAVLIAGVNTSPLSTDDAVDAAVEVIEKAQKLSLADTFLPWVDEDAETDVFIHFWFAQKQINDTRKLMTVIHRDYDGQLQAFLKVAISRLIITKEQCASLARDTSHSRPHRVSLTNEYEIFPNFVKSSRSLASRIPRAGVASAKVSRADARNLKSIANSTIDMVLTSPPYLNAIDYMRGHKLALVWLGYKLHDLRAVRSISIGAERKNDLNDSGDVIDAMTHKMTFYEQLEHRDKGMFNRYLLDILALMREVERVLKQDGKAILVVGNSCLKGVFIQNTMAVITAAEIAGLKLIDNNIRELPANRRYLPPPSSIKQSMLTNRMRTEAVLSFRKF